VTKKNGGDGRRPDWRSQLTTFLLAIAFGMAIHVTAMSGATAYRTIAASVTLAAMLTTSTRLRALHPRAPIVRYGVPLMLALSLGAAILAIVGQPNQAPYMILGAVGLTGAAVLVLAESIVIFRILAGMAVVGVAVAGVVLGVGFMNSHYYLGSVISAGLGVAGVGLGAAILAKN
jgi:hypothetical protein